MYYGGESNVPGAAGNLLAGSPGYFMPEAEMRQRMRQHYDQTPAGQEMNLNIQRLRDSIRQGTYQPRINTAFIPGSSNLPAAIGNMAGMSEAAYGNQGSQLPTGFSGKFVF